MSALSPSAEATTGTVTPVADWPGGGNTGRKVTAGENYDQKTYTSVLGRTYSFGFHLELRSLPSALTRVFQVINTASGAVASIRASSAGVLQMFDAEGNQFGSTLTLDPDAVYLVEPVIQQKAEGNGVASLWIDNEQIDKALSVKLTNTAWNRVRRGAPNTSAEVTITDGIVFRDLGVNDDQGETDNGRVGGTVYPKEPAALVPSGHGRLPVNPIGIAQVNNAQLRSNTDRLAVRFVPDRAMHLHRFLMGFNLEGVDKNGSGEEAPSEINPKGTGREGYGDGNGGTIKGQLVECNADGTPDLSNVIATVESNAVDLYEDSFAEYTPGSTKPNQILYLEFGEALQRGRLYAVVISNAHGTPLSNFFSVNCPTTSIAAAGPNRLNTLDEATPGAMAGLGPRECVMWSVYSGAAGSWVTGENVGADEAPGVPVTRAGGHIGKKGVGGAPDYYSGLDVSTDEKVRLPWYAFQDEDSDIQAIQPYYNYLEEVTGPVLTHRKAARATTLTEAVGYAPDGKTVKVITVKNLRTGVSGKTSSLGGGLASGVLDTPVPIEGGDTYTVSCTGTVFLEQADSFQVAIFGLGGGDWPFTTEGQESDRAALAALPHPYYRASAGPAPHLSLRFPRGPGPILS